MGFKLGKGSLAHLAGGKGKPAVHPRLQKVVHRAIEISKVDFKVICGTRTKAEQAALYAQGRTKPGKIVTWTMNSRHLPNQRTGFGHAVDLLPAPYDWNLKDNPDTPEKDDAFILMAEAMQQAADELGVTIRWGADWDRDGRPREKGESDNPHFELYE